MTKKKIIIMSGSGNTVVWFRLELIKEFLNRSYEVYVLAPDINSELKPRLDDLGAHFIYVNLSRKSLNPIGFLHSIYSIFSIIREIRPNLIFVYTFKAILVAAFASFFMRKIKLFSFITGRGHIFESDTGFKKVIKFISVRALRLAANFNETFIFQNPDDKMLFENEKIISNHRSAMVSGSGVNLDLFQPTPLPETPVFLCIARLLKSKGLIEYAESAKLVRMEMPNARFILYGYADQHEDSIDELEVRDSWFKKYGIEYRGYTNDPAHAISECSTFVLLSYQEGTPRVVLEAMAMGRPIITTDAPGCRETVINGFNGFQVPVKNSVKASQKMLNIVRDDLTNEYGLNSRNLCKQKFDVHSVNADLLKIMNVSP
jgi:glycosyltransferase involved in cell wall biosynthesis